MRANRRNIVGRVFFPKHVRGRPSGSTKTTERIDMFLVSFCRSRRVLHVHDLKGSTYLAMTFKVKFNLKVRKTLMVIRLVAPKILNILAHVLGVIL